MDRMPILKGQCFTIRENHQTVATGIVTNTFDPINTTNVKTLDKIVIPKQSEDKSDKSR